MKNLTRWDTDFLKDQLAQRTRHPVTTRMALDLAAYITGSLFNTRKSCSLAKIVARIKDHYRDEGSHSAEALHEAVTRATWSLPLDAEEFTFLAWAKGFPRNTSAIRQLCLDLIGTVHSLIETYAKDLNKQELGKELRLALKGHKGKKLPRD